MNLTVMTRSAQSRVERCEHRYREICIQKNPPPVKIIPRAIDTETALLLCIALLLIADSGSIITALAILYIAL